LADAFLLFLRPRTMIFPLSAAEARVEDAIHRIAIGETVVVLDDADRENEGDLILAAEKVTPEALAFVIRYTSGVVCVALSGERCDALELPPMVAQSTDPHGTAFTVTVDAKRGTTTGISAADRATTIRALASRSSLPSDFARPGHVFPLRARAGGVLSRRGHTEAACDLPRLAGLEAAGALCELARDDGSMMRLPELELFAREHRLALLHIGDLVAYRRRRERPLGRAPSPVQSARIRTAAGEAVEQQLLRKLPQRPL
jgi:3,4-dihydroxy 2-butanone 4-phosphate synthase/GTP cyclohydrolase II